MSRKRLLLAVLVLSGVGAGALVWSREGSADRAPQPAGPPPRRSASARLAGSNRHPASAS